MTCRNCSFRDDVGKSLGQVAAKDFEHSSSKQDHAIFSNIQHIFKSITTNSKSLVHTTEAPKDEKKPKFAMMNHFVINSQFPTITPDNECSF